MFYKIFWIFFGIFVLYKFLISNVFYIDIFNGCYIGIVPGLELNNAKIVEGLNVLKQSSIEDYKDVCNRVSKIDPNIGCGGFEGGCFYSTDPRAIVVTTAGTNLDWVVGVIVHETCHAKQFHEKRKMTEEECHNADGRVIKSIVQY